MDPAFEQLRTAAEILKVPLSPDALVGLDAYVTELLRWRDRVNLTGATTPRDLVNPHLIDVCLAVSTVEIPDRAAVVDIGSGAGLPGIPLKLIRRDVEMVLVEASRKKVSFLEHVRGALGLNDVRIECGRAETISRKAGWRERFDIAITQATADLSIAAELILPFVKIRGIGVCLKGADITDEISRAVSVIESLGGQVESSDRHPLPTTSAVRTIVVVRKVHATPEGFPRSSRVIGRKPRAHKGTRGSAAE